MTAELIAYFALLVVMCAWDVRSMAKDRLKRGYIPYLLLFAAAAAMGAMALRQQHQKGIASYLLDLFKTES